jgi:hypothetical protein
MGSVSLRHISPVARAVLVIGAVMALVTSMTFAALQNTATLTNNTISSDVDGLLVDSDGDDSFGTTDEGFAFLNIEPGGTSDAKAFSLKNDTADPMEVNVQVTGESALPAGVDPTDISFIFDLPGGDDNDVEATWAQIIVEDGVNLFNNLGAGVSTDLTVKVKLDPSVGDDVSIAPFNFTFGSPAVAETLAD